MTGRIFWPIYLMTFSKLSVWEDRTSFHSSIKHFWAWTLCWYWGFKDTPVPGSPQQMWPLICLHAWPTFRPGGEKEKLLEISLSHEVFTCLPLYPYPFLLLFSPSWLLSCLQMFHTPVTMNLPNSRCLVSWLRLTDWQVYFLWALSSVHIGVCVCICVCMYGHVCVCMWFEVRLSL